MSAPGRPRLEFRPLEGSAAAVAYEAASVGVHH